MLFELSCLSSNFVLTPGYFNPASNNPAQDVKPHIWPPSKEMYPSCDSLWFKAITTLKNQENTPAQPTNFVINTSGSVTANVE